MSIPKDTDVVLDVCYNAVERLALFLENNAARLDEERKELEADPDAYSVRSMRALGASMGNFLYSYEEVAEQDGLVAAFQRGLADFVAHCKELDRPKSRTPLRLVEFMSDNGVDSTQ
jgi:hypothetical protein